MSDLVGNPEDRFSHDEAHILTLDIGFNLSFGIPVPDFFINTMCMEKFGILMYRD